MFYQSQQNESPGNNTDNPVDFGPYRKGPPHATPHRKRLPKTGTTRQVRENLEQLSLRDAHQPKRGTSDISHQDRPPTKQTKTNRSSVPPPRRKAKAASRQYPLSNEKAEALGQGSHALSPPEIRVEPDDAGDQVDDHDSHSSMDEESLPTPNDETALMESIREGESSETSLASPVEQTSVRPPNPSTLPDRSKPQSSIQHPKVEESIVKQLDTRIIPINQVRRELEAIYGVVTTMETKCKHVLQTQKNAYRAYNQGKLKEKPDDHYTLVLALHRNLIHEEYDLFRASQYATTHPHASKDLDNFAEKVELPSRLWKHGIHNLLELFRSRLPESKEYLNAYIILGYQMFTLLLETVTDFQNQWLECLGDISRYRMAIETASAHERELWLQLSDAWYTKASVRQPDLGRLLHHRAILARSKGNVPMLNLYSRSLTTTVHFPTARDSLKITTFDTNMSLDLDLSTSLADASAKTPSKDVDKFCTDVFTRVHAAHAKNDTGKYNAGLQVWLDSACMTLITSDANRAAAAASSSVSAAPTYSIIPETIGLVNIAACLDWGADNALRAVFESAWEPSKVHDDEQAKITAEAYRKHAFRPWYLLTRTLGIFLMMKGHEIVLPHLHIILVFVWRLALCPHGLLYFASFPWSQLADHLNSIQMRTQIPHSRVTGPDFIHPYVEPEVPNPTPIKPGKTTGSGAGIDPQKESKPSKPAIVLREDQSMRGLVWSRGYFPKDHFSGLDESESDECGLLSGNGAEAVGSGRGSVGDAMVRSERCLWLAHRIIEAGKVAVKTSFIEGVSGIAGKQWLGFSTEDENGDRKAFQGVTL